MATKTLDIETLAVNTPAPVPSGYTKPAGSQDGRVAQLAQTREWQMTTGATQAVWYDNTLLTGTWISSTVVLGGSSGASCGPGLTDTNGNGWQAISVDGGSPNVRLFLMVNGQLSGSPLLTISQVHTIGNSLTLRRNTTSGLMQLLVNGVQIGTPGSNEHTSSTYNPRYAAMISRGGFLRSLTSEYTPDRSIDTLTTPLVLGSSYSITTTGFTNGIATLSFSGISSTHTLASGAGTGTLPSFSDNLLCPFLPATSVTVTETQSGNTATVTRDVNFPVSYEVTRNESNVVSNLNAIVTNDPKYIGKAFLDAANALTTNDRIYFPSAYGLRIYPDGRVTVNAPDHPTNPVPSLPYTFNIYVHRGSDTRIYEHSVTIDEDVVVVGNPPVMPADTSVSLEVGATVLGTFAATSGATPITYSLSGEGSSLFNINSSTGLVSFNSPATEGAGDITIVATNSDGSDSQLVSFEVSDNTPSITIPSNQLIAGQANSWTVTNFAPTSVMFGGMTITTYSNSSITIPAYVNNSTYPAFGLQPLVATDGVTTIELQITLLPINDFSYVRLTNVSNYTPGYIQGWTTCGVNDQIVFNTAASLGVADYAIDANGRIHTNRTTGSNLIVWHRRNSDGTMKQLQLIFATSLPSRLNVFGDSITVGTGASAENQRWVNKLANYKQLTLLNNGISGTVLQNSASLSGLPLANNGRDRYVSSLITGINLSSNYVIAYGLNDLRYNQSTPPSEFSVANYTNDLREVIVGLKAQGVPAANICLVTPYWIPTAGYSAGTAGFTSSNRTIHEQYVAAVIALAAEQGVVCRDVYTAMRDSADPASLVSGDNIHPNDLGHEFIFQFVKDVTMVAGKAPSTPITLSSRSAVLTDLSGNYISNDGLTSFNGIGQLTGSFTVGVEEAWIEGVFDNTTDAGLVFTFGDVSGLPATSGNKYLVLMTSTGQLFRAYNGAASTATGYTVPAAGANVKVRLKCGVDGVVVIQTSEDSIAWTTRYTFATPASGVYYGRIYTSGVRRTYQPKSFGIQ